MQKYNVPQFVEIEDKIIGPFTLRQFLTILAGGVFVMLFWMIFKLSFLFWALSVPTALLALFIALGSFNGQPVLMSILPGVGFLFGSKKLLFRHEAPEEIIKKAPVEKAAPQAPPDVHNRLKRLAYILDQKVQEEEGLDQGVMPPSTYSLGLDEKQQHNKNGG